MLALPQLPHGLARQLVRHLPPPRALQYERSADTRFAEHNFYNPRSSLGLALVGETTSGALLSAEMAGSPSVLPEEVGVSVADALLEEVGACGAVDSSHQPLLLTLMCLGPEDVSRVRLGRELTPQAVDTLRLLRDFVGVAFTIDPDPADGSLLLACRGVGLVNINKRVT